MEGFAVIDFELIINKTYQKNVVCNSVWQFHSYHILEWSQRKRFANNTIK